MGLKETTGLRHRREVRAATLLALALWCVALVLWTMPGLAAGNPFSMALVLLLAQTFAVGLVFSAIIAIALMGVERWDARPPILAAAALTLTLALVHGWLDAIFVNQLRAAGGLAAVPIWRQFVFGLMPFILVYGLYASGLGLVFSSMVAQERERQLAAAQSAAQQAQLAALRFQLNPHFLFNTLNAISSLVITRRNDEAEGMIGKLSDFLRASLEADPQREVTLDEEFATLQAYLEIEAVRFRDRLDAEFVCPAELLDALVPSFILQPLIENAVKYAVAPSRRAVRIVVRAAAAEPAVLHLCVEDDGGQAFGGGAKGGTGLGLANVRHRLEAFYGSEGALIATARERGFVASMTLPLHRAHRAEAAE
ncbi:sensor histidine kinase [Sphingomonas sp. Sphisp140]|uniref:sensor histidine kinase n=1 Tax=unclassified Sphingomonas TaxID=196159 RepID=UPI0039AFDD54